MSKKRYQIQKRTMCQSGKQSFFYTNTAKTELGSQVSQNSSNL